MEKETTAKDLLDMVDTLRVTLSLMVVVLESGKARTMDLIDKSQSLDPASSEESLMTIRRLCQSDTQKVVEELESLADRMVHYPNAIRDICMKYKTMVRKAAEADIAYPHSKHLL